MPSIRELDLERDADDLLALTRQVYPTVVTNRAGLIHRLATVPARVEPRFWVAEAGGRVVGQARAFRDFFADEPKYTILEVSVREEHRRQGIGHALYETGLAHARTLGLPGLIANMHESEAGLAFATKRGYRVERTDTDSAIDPRTVVDAPPADVDLRPVADVDLHLVHAVDLEASRDMPWTDVIDDIPYDEWLGHVPAHPLFTAEGSFVAMADGLAAAVSLLLADPESGRAVTMFTGTLRAYRGRGLARAVKLATIHWAAANGIESLVTTNDETNAAMLAVNRRLGYRPVGRRLELVAELRGS